MIRLLVALFFALTSNFVHAETIKCFISVNAERVVETEFSVLPGNKELFADSGDYRFFMKNFDHSKFELEVYDVYAPSRSYSTGFLRTSEDELAWAFWSRDVLIETTCKLIQ